MTSYTSNRMYLLVWQVSSKDDFNAKKKFHIIPMLYISSKFLRHVSCTWFFDSACLKTTRWIAQAQSRMMSFLLASHTTLLLAGIWQGCHVMEGETIILCRPSEMSCKASFQGNILVNGRRIQKPLGNLLQLVLITKHQNLSSLFVWLQVLVTPLIKSAMTHQSIVISAFASSAASGKAPNSPSSPPFNPDPVSQCGNIA